MVPVPLQAAAALAATLVLSAGAARAQAPDPFAPHHRWTSGPAAGEDWLPRSLDFAAEGELVFGAGSLGAPRALLLSSPELPPGGGLAPLSESPLSLAQGDVLTVAGPGADALYVAWQAPSQDPAKRVTTVARLHAPGGALQTLWTRDLPLVGNGAVRMAADRSGARIVAAVNDGLTGQLVVEWLEPATGAVQSSRALAAGTLRGLCLSSDATRAAVVAGTDLWVFDASGATLHHETLALATHALALSGDGKRLAIGAGGRLRVLGEELGWLERGALPGATGEVATRAAISDDGSVLAVGWWSQLNGVDARFELIDGDSLATLFEAAQPGLPGGLQGFPEVVAVTPDGRRAAYGTWGLGDPQPELLLVDVPTAAVILQVDLPGSVRALALDPTGTRVAVGMKHGHANQFASSGEFRLYDTGERELQVIGQPTPTGTLHLAARRPGASRTLFVLGAPLARPVPFRGGALWIDRGQPLLVRNRPADASGRSDVVLSLPALSAVVGVDFAVQAVWRVGGGLQLGPDLLCPAVLWN